MYTVYGDKQRTNNNAMQRHTYSGVLIDIHTSFADHTTHDHCCLETVYMPMGLHFSWTIQRDFDGMMKVLLVIINSPLLRLSSCNAQISIFWLPSWSRPASAASNVVFRLPPTLCSTCTHPILYCSIFFLDVFLAVSPSMVSCGDMVCLSIVLAPSLSLSLSLRPPVSRALTLYNRALPQTT